MITCRHLTEFLLDYLSGALPPGEDELFARHLEICPACVTYLETYQQTVSLGKQAFSAEDEPVPEEVPEELVRAILEARGAAR